MIFQHGEIVDITIKGVRIYAQDEHGCVVVLAEAHDIPEELNEAGLHGPAQFLMPPQAAVTRVAPASWPPRPGDLWRGHRGALHFAASYSPDYDDPEDCRGIDSGGVRVVLLSQHSDESCTPGHRMHRPETVLRDCGPLTLVHRENEQDGDDRG